MKDLSPLPALALAVCLAATVAACGPRSSPRSGPEVDPVQVGYGARWHGDVTGSVASLTADDLDGQRVGTVEELLRDRVSGLLVSRRPDGSLSVRVRGNRSLLGSNEPLVVIDGMPVNAQSVSLALTGVPPQIVARIDVLKDAGSTAAYGSRGANGVILVTTRRSADR
jgi:TonB-dependent starch-binding outer membrane protein SusC